MSVLGSAVIFLAATVIAVPIFKKLKLGAILGYLVAGLVIGPQMMNWVNDPVTILHFAELGVVLLLFVIGLELQPEKLWRMRNQILLTGGGQLLISALVIALILHFFMAFSWMISLVIGLSLALSSTAFSVQLMKEHRILKSPPGQQGFSILLMQDLAVIPILLLVENLSTTSSQSAPPWWISVFAIVAVLAVGRYLTNPFLRLVSKYGSEEVMTAAALLIVIATAIGMQEAGLSMGMGAFVAGILLANSSFRHQLEAEVEPFKGLLLGLFFIAIGMNLDLSLLVTKPLFILSASAALVLIKTGVIFSILKIAKQRKTDAIRIGLMLSQGGEFAFVVMAQASGNGLLPMQISSEVTLIVGISMALTAPLVIVHSLWFTSKNCPAVYDTSAQVSEPEVLIAGFGRFGQVSARILAANNIPFTALDKNAEHIEFVKQFGNKVFFGDACRLDLLEAAGIAHARVILVAVDDEDDALKIAQLVTDNFPSVKVIARAKNRFTAVKLTHLGVATNVREVFAGGLEAATMLLQAYGLSDTETNSLINIFDAHDRALLESTILKNMDIDQLVALSNQDRQELHNLFEEDKQNID
jgi:monovalent cation:proton antiporter-2 (CPA2) family protein